MASLNSVLLEGTFLHFTSKKGAKDVSFLLNNNTNFGCIASGKIGDIIVSSCKKGKKVRLVGKLEKRGRSTLVRVEHIDIC